MRKVLLDTNIYISAILFGGKPRKILEDLISEKMIGYVSDSILEEIELTLQKPKFGLSQDFISAVVIEIDSITIKTKPSTLKNYSGLRDRDDYHILEAAISASVDYLITGDKDLLILERVGAIEILSPETFLKLDS